MRKHQEGQTVEVEMEKLNGDPCAESLQKQRNGLKCGIFLASLIGLVAVVVTCLLFLFVFGPACNQEAVSAQTPGKVNSFRRLGELNLRGQSEIFRADKAAKYWIHGWLKRLTDSSERVRLVHTLDGETRRRENNTNNLQTDNVLYFSIEVHLFINASISLEGQAKVTDGCFYIHEL